MHFVSVPSSEVEMNGKAFENEQIIAETNRSALVVVKPHATIWLEGS